MAVHQAVGRQEGKQHQFECPGQIPLFTALVYCPAAAFNGPHPYSGVIDVATAAAGGTLIIVFITTVPCPIYIPLRKRVRVHQKYQWLCVVVGMGLLHSKGTQKMVISGQTTFVPTARGGASISRPSHSLLPSLGIDVLLCSLFAREQTKAGR